MWNVVVYSFPTDAFISFPWHQPRNPLKSSLRLGAFPLRITWPIRTEADARRRQHQQLSERNYSSLILCNYVRSVDTAPAAVHNIHKFDTICVLNYMSYFFKMRHDLHFHDMSPLWSAPQTWQMTAILASDGWTDRFSVCTSHVHFLDVCPVLRLNREIKAHAIRD